MTAYYNEFDPFAAQWLRNLIAEGLIAPGDVDERSIEDVQPDELAGYTQCHFFAGIGGWSLALRLAGWPDDRPVWSGSCPCQPLSSAGNRKGHDDERHLWPAFYRLIAERRPATVVGEQVASKLGREWLAGVRADLEGLGYACGAADLCAASVGAPHIRQRLFWVGQGLDDTAGPRRKPARQGAEGEAWDQARLRRSECGRATGRLAVADGRNPGAERLQRGGEHGFEPEDGSAGGLGDAAAGGQREHRSPPGNAGYRGDERGRRSGEARRPSRPAESQARERQRGWLDPWSGGELLPCTDGKARRIEPGSFPLAHGIPARMGRLRAYGNAIVPQVAAEFIAAYIEARG